MPTDAPSPLPEIAAWIDACAAVDAAQLCLNEANAAKANAESMLGRALTPDDAANGEEFTHPISDGIIRIHLRGAGPDRVARLSWRRPMTEEGRLRLEAQLNQGG